MKINWKKLIVFILGTMLIGSIFAIFTMNNDTYKMLNKPLEVPGIVFPIVWTILYTLMGISLYIISESNSLDKGKSYIIYIIQLLINSLWTLIFFGFNAYLFAFIWLLLLIVMVIIMIINFYSINKLAGLLQIPYLLWLIFAGYLNLSIYLLN